MQELSFSYRAKQEIIERINSRDKADACLMGVLLCANKLGTDEISVLTENAMLRDFFVLNVGRILGCDDGVTVGEIQRRGSAVLYDLSITRAQDRLFILDYFQLDESRGMSRDDLPKEKYYPYVVGGIFLACGSVNNPEKKYHMEFVMPTLTLQPVVENAINYGALTCKKQKGKVILKTRRENDQVVITVWNNFEGKRSVTEGQKKHRSIATENIRSRLKYFCEGTYEIDIRETDAIATIRLPMNKVMGGLVS